MKVLHLLNHTGGGGTESYILSLIREMGDTCDFYLAYSEEGSGHEAFQELGVEMFRLEMKSAYDLAASKKLRDFCRDKEIDLIHTHFLRENYIAILSKFLGNKVKVVNTRHMIDENKGMVRLTNRFMTRFNSGLIAVSKIVEELLREEVPSAKISLIYSGLDLDLWKKEDQDSFREEYGLDRDTKIITSAARFSEEKGHEFLIYSIRDFLKLCQADARDLDKIKFVLVGDGPLLEDMKELGRKLSIEDNLIFTGYRKDVRNILNSSDIYISASKMESFGISILEAMAMEVPVISTDSGGTKEIIIDGENGYLINYGDRLALSDRLKEILDDGDLKYRIGQKGLETVRKRFSLEETARRTYELYSS